jgi:guanylate kinase
MANRLEHLEAFKKVLADYHIAQSDKKVLADVKLALLTGASGAGRDTIIAELLKSGKYYHVVSDTTREPRVNNGVPEQNGVEYWFRSEEDFLADLRAGRLLEAELIHNQQVSGISIRELEKAEKQEKVAITNVDLNIRSIVQAKPDTYAFLVIPPSFEEWMRRLDGRGIMPLPEKRRRLETAVRIFEAGLEWDFFTYLINDDFKLTVERIHQIVFMGEHDPLQQQLGREVTEKLLVDTEAALRK